MPTAWAASTLISRSSTSRASCGPQPEAVERQIVDGRVGLEQFDLARDDDVAEAGEEVALLVMEGRPEVGREIGDREERHALLVERLDDVVDAGHAAR